MESIEELTRVRAELDRLKSQRAAAVKKWRRNNRDTVNRWAAQRYARLKTDAEWVKKNKESQRSARLRRKAIAADEAVKEEITDEYT
jgi:hypothetical protein